MFIKSISLQDFRIYSQQNFVFDDLTTIVLGENGSGKTSLIEAISLLSNGVSFRAGKIEEMINFDHDLARVKGMIKTNSTDQSDELADLDKLELEIILTRGMVQGKKTRKSLYSVNQVKRRKKDFVANFYTVVFRPEDLRLVEGSPSRRRSFIDAPLSLVDREYARSLKTYEQALKRRNRLLFLIKEGKQKPSVLSYWNLSLVKNGQILQIKRKKFFEFLQTIKFPMSFSVEYQPSVISEKRMKQYLDKEMIVGHTLIGPHKDDFDIKLKGLGGVGGKIAASKAGGKSVAGDNISGSLVKRSLAKFGSRGQQRMGVLWLKIGELEFLERETGAHPILLLDDILSELDGESRDKVLTLLGRGQAVISTTDERLVRVIKQATGEVGVIRLKN